MKSDRNLIFLLIGIPFAIALFSLIPFMFMILIGIAGHAFHEPHLYLSYGQSVITVLLIAFVGTIFGVRGK